MKNEKKLKYALIGNPVEGSLSPLIHDTMFEEYNLNAKYELIKTNKESIDEIINDIKTGNIDGANITIPFKEEILSYVDELENAAFLCSSCNAIKGIDGKIIGTNTDGMGFLLSLKHNNVYLDKKNILLLGAGGAAKGIVAVLMENNVNKIYIKNRNSNRAEALITDISKKISKKTNLLITRQDEYPEDVDIIINATSCGMLPNENASPESLSRYNNVSYVIDIIYKPLETELLKEAKSLNIPYQNGILMLVYQAIYSEFFWGNIKRFDVRSLCDKITKKVISNI